MIICGDALTELRKLPDESVNCCITSPPYWGLRDYGMAGQLGLERTPEEYVGKLVEIFREVRRALRRDGSVWLNLGDTYASSGQGGHQTPESGPFPKSFHGHRLRHGDRIPRLSPPPGLKPKDLVGIPWRAAFALQADGWYLRSDIIWAKPNPMPESVRDRPTRSHEYIFLLTKSKRYFYNAKAIAEPVVYGDHPRNGCPGPDIQAPGQAKQSGITRIRRSGNKERVLGPGRGRPDSHLGGSIPWWDRSGKRNCRSVWTITNKPMCREFAGIHFATFPPALIEPMIKAGCPKAGAILDPFFGAGTVGIVAKQLGREFIGIELNPAYIKMAERRIAQVGYQMEITP